MVVSTEPLPSYAAWKKARGPVPWQKHAPGQGVWSSDGDGIYRVVDGKDLRGSERDLPNAPPLSELCRALKQAGRAEIAESLAFPVKAKAKE